MTDVKGKGKVKDGFKKSSLNEWFESLEKHLFNTLHKLLRIITDEKN